MTCSIGKLKSGKRRASETRAATLARSRTANGKLTPKRSTIPRTAQGYKNETCRGNAACK